MFEVHFFIFLFKGAILASLGSLAPKYEPPHEKTNNLQRRKQRRRSASR